MIFNVGFQSFEFLQAHEFKPMYFGSNQDALSWLKQIAKQDSDLISRLRDYLTRYSGDPENFRLTDQQMLERLAILLHSRRIVVIGREQRGSGGKPTPSTEAAAPAFPLSERSSRAPSASYQPPPETDSPIFDPNVDGDAQADALVAAAADGKPFCPEWMKRQAAVAAGNTNW
jgi:hypothetical protein